jgi:hypothetical protein
LGATVLGRIDKLLQYLSRSVAARFCVWQSMLSAWLAAKRYPMGKSLVQLRTFLDAEAKRQPQGNGIRPMERVPIKIVMPMTYIRENSRFGRAKFSANVHLLYNKLDLLVETIGCCTN